MVSTFQSVLVVFLALLPGALYTWGFERQVGQWGVSLADRLLRFFGWSALLHVLPAPITYLLWDRYYRSGRIAAGDAPLWLWFIALGYVAAPAVLGLIIGHSARHHGRLGRVVAGRHPSPTGWEHLFANDPVGVIRIRLAGGSYVAGLFGTVSETEWSYATGFPHQPIDLWLARAIEVDADTGEFHTNADGSPVLLGSGILVRYDEVQLLEFIPQEV